MFKIGTNVRFAKSTESSSPDAATPPATDNGQSKGQLLRVTANVVSRKNLTFAQGQLITEDEARKADLDPQYLELAGQIDRMAGASGDKK